MFVARPLESVQSSKFVIFKFRPSFSDAHTATLYPVMYTFVIHHLNDHSTKKQKYSVLKVFSSLLWLLDFLFAQREWLLRIKTNFKFHFPADTILTWDYTLSYMINLTCTKHLNLFTLPRKVQLSLLRSLKPILFKPDLLWRLELVPSLLFLA